MIVPNFIPDPLEVPGNVTEHPYLLRLRFIRTVALLFLGSVFFVAMLAKFDLPQVGLWQSCAIFGGSLICLELWRIWTRGRPIEGQISAAVCPLILLVAAFVVRELTAVGLPVWQGLVGPTCFAIYALACGRDFSFVGALLLSLIASAVCIAAIALSTGMPVREEIFAHATNASLVIYLTYDLASLLSRRRVGEELAAVTDIYRDVFNLFGYVIRVVKHWQRHRIWSKS